MKYIVIEIQKNANGTIGILVNDFDNENDAWSKYHLVLSAAAVSALPSHSAMIANETGYCIDHKCYVHEAAGE